jgi:hypothetical protein
MKKIKALNEESSMGSSVDEMTKGITMGNEMNENEDDDSPSSSSSSSSEETKDLNQGKNPLHGARDVKKSEKRSNNDEGEISSVTTRQNKTERYHYILRMAIDERYIPSSISNIGYAAYIIFVILVLLASKPS